VDSAVINILVISGGTIGAAAFLWAVRAAWRGGRRASRFFDDWFGQEARPGVPAVPGFPERMQSVEVLAAGTAEIVSRELQKNGGQSALDKLTRIDENTKPS